MDNFLRITTVIFNSLKMGEANIYHFQLKNIQVRLNMTIINNDFIIAFRHNLF